jgi:NhaA family Na+:H+ antiporter
MGLEFDHDITTRDDSSRLHLPTTSLSALEHLRLFLRVPGCVTLNLSSYSLYDDLLDLVASQGKLSAAAVIEARTNLRKRSEAFDASTSTSDLQISKTLSSDKETIDISVCPLRAFDHKLPPMVSFAGMPSPIRTGGDRLVKYAALVLCSEASESSIELANCMARGLAAAFMDDRFAEKVRAASPDRPEHLLAAFDSYLSCLTIVPTVYVPREGNIEETTAEYLLSDSLAYALGKTVGGSTGLPVLDGVAQPYRESPRRRRRTFHLQVNTFSPADSQWIVAQCLRQGLEVDMAAGELQPHLPCVSMQALGLVRQLISSASVQLDVSIDGFDKATELVAAQLGAVGLPSDAIKEVKRALQVGALPFPGDQLGYVSESHSRQQTPTDASKLFMPSDADETCNLLVMPQTQLLPSHGFFGAFFRFRASQKLPFVASAAPCKFLFVFVGSQKAQTELVDLSHSLAVLATDEDLMEHLASVTDAASFVSAIDDRLNDLMVIPHASIEQTGAQSESLETVTLSAPDSPAPAPPKRRTSFDSCSSLFSVNDGIVVKPPQTLPEQLRELAQTLRRNMQKYSMPLIFGVLLALTWSNIDEKSYHDFTHNKIFGLEWDGHEVSMHFIVNDFFMCFFFGLAVKEVTEAVLPGGSLSPLRRAVNPLMATLGGILGPVAVYVICILVLHAMGSFDATQCETESSATTTEVCSLSVLLKGWGVPTATDISLAWMFALIIFGAGHPAINVLLLLAIVDDAIGMLIIAVFYPNPKKPVEPLWLFLVVGGMIVASGMRFIRISVWQAYVFVAGPISWYGLFKAHVHPALALAFVVPFMPASIKKPPKVVVRDVEEGPGERQRSRHSIVHHKMAKAAKRVAFFLEDQGSGKMQNKSILAAAEAMSRLHHAPLHEFEHVLKWPVDLGMFFFGLANAGVQLGSVGGITFSVVVALLVGKTLGIAGFSLLAVCLGFDLPAGVSIPDLFALSALGGIGLTVALFVSNEAFVDPGLRGQSKMGAVMSVVAGGLAWGIKALSKIMMPEVEEDEETLYESDGRGIPPLPSTSTTSLRTSSTMRSDVDQVLVDDILQVMWTARQYKARGMKMPMTEKTVRSSSKNSCGRRSASKEGRRTSKESLRHHSKESLQEIQEETQNTPRAAWS